jgi:hypothetical protein
MWYKFTNVLEEQIASISIVKMKAKQAASLYFNAEDGVSMFL